GCTNDTDRPALGRALRRGGAPHPRRRELARARHARGGTRPSAVHRRGGRGVRHRRRREPLRRPRRLLGTGGGRPRPPGGRRGGAGRGRP
ncbi:MAG: Glutamate-1-semialdehyde 2,1-aminomutase, partial [uncultured Thermoleophilia bacterium]